MIQPQQYTDAQQRFLTAFTSGLAEEGITVCNLLITERTVRLAYEASNPAETETAISEVQFIAGRYLGLAKEATWTPLALEAVAMHPDYEPGEWRLDEEVTAGFASGEMVLTRQTSDLRRNSKATD